MPLSPVSVVVGTTLATAIVVIGTGYAFKKFVYDPHISHHIEALIAQHHQAHSHPYAAIPIPVSEEDSNVPVEGISTSYRDHHTSLRRRNINRSSSGPRPHEYELQERPVEHFRENVEDEANYGGASKYELDESRLSLLGDHPTKSTELIDLDDNFRAESPQDREIQEVIFNLVPTPLRSGSSTPSAQNPFSTPDENLEVSHLDIQRGRLDPRTSSTSFSFLSLSQVSSPEQTPRFPFAHQDEEGTSTIADDNDTNDVISISDHGMTQYEDAESYTPISRSISRNSIPITSPRAGDRDLVGEMGLSYVPVIPITRGAMSVISVDGSEMSESDWDVVSESGR
ncbi:uncharacterized protein I206_101784 [Kwoniella pini CBS 10737]|uniref:Uncharacterized protein n=1 Tax=Kwoniella pini CBS 10737 TaxID=1296096 RepID=A0A1B9HVR1_9TREE|nr:uncharacterized protein I206_06244 [Kwoniella pini CBS 10737]OCF47348.1 hypothetical protein I206_06244 [Kwoniella pini CBS 10737]